MSIFAVVGGGLAAAHAVETLRDSGYDGRLVLFGDEPHRPYERPPLSKGFLLGDQELDKAFVHTPQWYDDHGVELRLGAPVTALDLTAKTITVTAEPMTFDKLLLATGATPRHLPIADESGAPVHYLRTIEDSERIKAVLKPGARVVIVGGGWIGLEVAAAARLAGCQVTVVELSHKPLLRVLGPELADVFARLHTDHGVELRTGVRIHSILGNGFGTVLALDDGTEVRADVLVVGIGVEPSTRLAEASHLHTSDGIVVDQHLRSSHPDVFAAGDVASAYHPALRRHIRVEHWDNAIAQGRTAARNMCGGEETYDRLPYFFTDQYDLGIEYVGHVGPEGYDDVVLSGDVPGRVFRAFWISRGRVVAGMHANDWDAIDEVRRVVEQGDPPAIADALAN